MTTEATGSRRAQVTAVPNADRKAVRTATGATSGSPAPTARRTDLPVTPGPGGDGRNRAETDEDPVDERPGHTTTDHVRAGDRPDTRGDTADERPDTRDDDENRGDTADEKTDTRDDDEDRDDTTDEKTDTRDDDDDDRRVKGEEKE